MRVIDWDSEEEEDGLTAKELQKLPYVLLLNPATNQAAVYSPTHRLLASQASARLIAYGLEHATKQEAWSDERDQHWNRERPTWAADGSLQGCVLYWLRDGHTPIARLRAMPKK